MNMADTPDYWFFFSLVTMPLTLSILQSDRVSKPGPPGGHRKEEERGAPGRDADAEERHDAEREDGQEDSK